MYCVVYNIDRIKWYDNNNIKIEWGEMEVYCYKILLVYLKW